MDFFTYHELVSGHFNVPSAMCLSTRDFVDSLLLIWLGSILKKRSKRRTKTELPCKIALPAMSVSSVPISDMSLMISVMYLLEILLVFLGFISVRCSLTQILFIHQSFFFSNKISCKEIPQLIIFSSFSHGLSLIFNRKWFQFFVFSICLNDGKRGRKTKSV